MKPFDLEKALVGESVKLRDGSKATIYANLAQYEVEFPLKGIEHTGGNFSGELAWTLQGEFYPGCVDDKDIVGMWEEPRPTVTLTLPCPLKEPQEEMWFISEEFNVYKSSYSERCISNLSNDWFSQGRYFASEADAQAWVNAFKNNRR